MEATPVAATWAAFTYTGIVARTVVAAKVGGHHAVWPSLGAHLGSVVARAPCDVDVVVPVTTEPGRARRRGFDHAVVMARQVARVLELPSERALRTRRRTPDRGRDHHARELPAGAMWATSDLAGRQVLLVDDVMTTGATLRAAATAVAAAGAARVEAAVLARAGR